MLNLSKSTVADIIRRFKHEDRRIHPTNWPIKRFKCQNWQLKFQEISASPNDSSSIQRKRL
ncbi:hypothetical protein WN51_10560 [Melipona quadrifasciata]|uniref:Uncharacterized protein n=1 Tax=Melipona quadrifasciata TaxID=166423 RepID=A0A0M9A5Q2_9HYME|nr:hypothetical protein WN51_10560 [Melipona quadrifasciata]